MQSPMDHLARFPGRWLAGGSLILGPLLLLAGVLLRLPVFFSLPPEELVRLQAEPTFFPLELAAYQRHPGLIVTAYGAFLAGNIFLWPAVATLAGLIAARQPAWGLWGGALTIFGLFARTFHAGVDHFAFQLTRLQGLDAATQAVAGSYGAVSYGPFDLVGVLGFAVLLGWVLLAVGAYRSGVLGPVRAGALGLMALLLQGVLKGGTLMALAATLGLCIACIPLGMRVVQGSVSLHSEVSA